MRRDQPFIIRQLEPLQHSKHSLLKWNLPENQEKRLRVNVSVKVPFEHTWTLDYFCFV